MDKNKLNKKVIKYGIACMDSKTNGIKSGQVVVIGARQGIGKSLLSLNIAINISKQKFNVIYYSLEMPKDQMFNRVNSILNNIPNNKYENYTISDSDINSTIANPINQQINSLNFVFKTKSRIQDIEQDIIKYKSKNELNLVIIDYIQLLKG